jgi:hypothetical protein
VSIDKSFPSDRKVILAAQLNAGKYRYRFSSFSQIQRRGRGALWEEEVSSYFIKRIVLSLLA